MSSILNFHYLLLMFHFNILMFQDEIEITYCYSHVSRREWETQIEFLKVEREKSQSIFTRSRENENSRWSLYPACVFCPQLNCVCIANRRKVWTHNGAWIAVQEKGGGRKKRLQQKKGQLAGQKIISIHNWVSIGGSHKISESLYSI